MSKNKIDKYSDTRGVTILKGTKEESEKLTDEWIDFYSKELQKINSNDDDKRKDKE